MRETIYKDDVIMALKNEDCFGYIECETEKLYNSINALPTADPPSATAITDAYYQGVLKGISEAYDKVREHGEWIIETDDIGNTYGRCPICGMRQYAGQINFCPECGSDMRKGMSENPLAGIDLKPIPTEKHTFSYRKGADDE